MADGAVRSEVSVRFSFRLVRYFFLPFLSLCLEACKSCTAQCDVGDVHLGGLFLADEAFLGQPFGDEAEVAFLAVAQTPVGSEGTLVVLGLGDNGCQEDTLFQREL